MNNVDKLLTDLSSGYWWLTVVGVGLLVNLASAYLKPTLDRWYEKRSSLAQARQAKSNADFEIEASILARSNALLVLKCFEATRWQLATIMFLSVGLVFLVTTVSATREHGQVIFYLSRFPPVLCIVFAIWAQTRASQAAVMVRVARLHLLKAIVDGQPVSTE